MPVGNIRCRFSIEEPKKGNEKALAPAKITTKSLFGLYKYGASSYYLSSIQELLTTSHP